MAAPRASRSSTARSSKKVECSERSSRTDTARGFWRVPARTSAGEDTVAGKVLARIIGSRYRASTDPKPPGCYVTKLTIVARRCPMNRPWISTYDPGVPAEVDIPDEPLHLALARSAHSYPERAAIRFYRSEEHSLNSSH